MKDITQEERKIYALYDNNTIRVYQAYNAEIAEEALKLGTFGSHFSLTRMTWIKPSFLWMMYRCGWAEKENQERVLAIDIKREAFDEIVRKSVLSSYKADLGIQLGIRGTFVEKYVNDWIVKITDITEEVKRIKQHIDKGTFTKDLLPKEQEYIVQ